MNLGRNIRKFTSEFFIGLRIKKGPSYKLSDIFPNASSGPINCTTNLVKTTLDCFKGNDDNLSYNPRKCSSFNFAKQEINYNILPTLIHPFEKKIIEPDFHTKTTIGTPININTTKIVDLPTNIVKEMFDPLKDTVKKEAGMSLVRIKRKKMRRHKYKKLHRKRKALFLKLGQAKMLKKEAIFQEELKQILNSGKNYSAEKYVEENLEKLDWKPPVTRARGRLAPAWVIEKELDKQKFNQSVEIRAKECAKKMRKKLF